MHQHPPSVHPDRRAVRRRRHPRPRRARRTGRRPGRRLRGGRFADGVISGDPRPTGSRCGRASTASRRRAPSSSRSPRDQGFRKVVARKNIKTSGGQTTRSRPGSPASSPTSSTTTASPPRPRTPASGASAPRCRRTPTRPCASRSSPAQDFTHGYYNAHEKMAQGGPRLRGLPGRLHLRRDLPPQGRRHGGARRQGRPPARRATTASTSPPDAERLPRQVLALPLGPVAAQDAREASRWSSLWDDHEVQNNYAGSADRRRPAADEEVLAQARQARRLPGVLRVACRLAPGGATGSTARINYGRNVELFVTDQRQYRDNQPCGDAVVPAVRRLGPAARLPGPQADGLASRTALTASKASWKFMANELMVMPTKVARRQLLHLRLLAGLPAGARGAAGPHQDQGDQGRRLRHRRHPHVHRRRRPHAHGRGRDRRAGVRRRLDHLTGPGRDRPRRRRRRDHQGQRPEPQHRPRRSSTPCAASTRGSTRPTSTTTATARSSPRSPSFDCDLVRIETIKKKTTKTLPSSGLPLQGRPRADLDQGPARAGGLRTSARRAPAKQSHELLGSPSARGTLRRPSRAADDARPRDAQRDVPASWRRVLLAIAHSALLHGAASVSRPMRCARQPEACSQMPQRRCVCQRHAPATRSTAHGAPVAGDRVRAVHEDQHAAGHLDEPRWRSAPPRRPSALDVVDSPRSIVGASTTRPWRRAPSSWQAASSGATVMPSRASRDRAVKSN